MNAVLRRIFAPLADARTWAVGGYLLLGLPLGGLWWIIALCGVFTGVLLALLWLGVLILALTFAVLRGAGHLERVLARRMLGASITTPYRPSPGPGLRVRGRAVLADPATWRDLAFLALRLPVSAAGTAFLVPLWLAGWILAAMPIRYLRTDGPVTARFNGERLFTVEGPASALALSLVGLALLIGSAHLVRLLGRGHARLAEALLRPTAGTRAHRMRLALDEERRHRAATLEIAAEERRRLERDLHDGAQQRLVALAMDLGMAIRKIDADPPEARRLVTEARDQAVQTLEEIRTLVRGLHPAILAEQGLDAALSALAGRCPVPVEVRVECADRPAVEAETAAYFVVAEALTNVARHAVATRATVTITCEEGLLLTEVRDDGKGGADPDGGTGLAGLRDRVTALSGRLEVVSPAGGPTLVRAELPCGW